MISHLLLLLTIAFLALLFYAVTYGMGCGLSRILLKENKALEPFLTPWIGIAQTGLILILFGFLGVGTNRSSWAAVFLSLIFLIVSLRKRDPDSGDIEKLDVQHWKIILGIVFLTTFLMAPVIIKSKAIKGLVRHEAPLSAVTSFTIGNNDIIDYTLTARLLQEHGLWPYVKPFGEQPAWKNATAAERVASWQIPAPRWLSYYYLSFLSSLTQMDTAQLFSLYTIFLYALFVPLIWLFARRVAGLENPYLILGFLFALANPHIYYILFNAFLPQIAATGFFISFCVVFPQISKRESFDLREMTLISLLAAATLASYLEVFSFLIFTAVVYWAFLAATRAISWTTLSKKLIFFLGTIALLCPYQASRFLPVIFWHSGMAGGGWPVTERYYLFLFQLGGFLSHPHKPNPSLILERIIDPLIFILIVLGLRRAKFRHYLLIMALPFVVSGLIAYRHDWNYRFYKNFTYLYFWLPLIAASGMAALHGWQDGSAEKWKRAVAKCAGALFIFIGLLAASKTCEGMAIWTWKAALAPPELRNLESVNKNPQIKIVFLSGLSFSESLWAAYHLSDKNVVMNHVNGYLRNDAVQLSDPRFQYAFFKERFSTLFDPLSGRKISKEILRFDRYVFCELEPGLAQPQIDSTLKDGFYDVESDSREEWVWSTGNSQMLIDSSQPYAAEIILDVCSRQDQSLEIASNEKNIRKVELKKDTRQTFRVPVRLSRGKNSIKLKTDGGSAPEAQGDPRSLSLRFFQIRIARF